MKIDLAEYNCGITPVGPRLVVYPTPVKEITSGGILMPTQVTEREELKQIEALVIKVGVEAFEDVAKPWAKPGDTVLLAAFAGRTWTGPDEKKYRIILDGDVMAIKDESSDNQHISPVGIIGKEVFGDV